MSMPTNFQPYWKLFGHPNEEVRNFLFADDPHWRKFLYIYIYIYIYKSAEVDILSVHCILDPGAKGSKHKKIKSES